MLSMRIIGAVVAVSLIGAMAAACSDDKPSAEEAQAKFCGDLQQLNTAVNQLPLAQHRSPRSAR